MPDGAAPSTVRDLRRGQILAAARQLVAEEGLHALTIAALEGRLAFSRGVITYHFKNKDEIVHAVLESAVAEIDRAVDDAVRAAPPGAARVEAAVRGMVHGFLGHDEASQILLAFWSRIRSDPRAEKTNADLYARYRAMAAKLLRTGVKRGDFPADVDATALAGHMVGTVIGVVTQTLFAPGEFPSERVLDEAARTFAARLGGPARAGR